MNSSILWSANIYPRRQADRLVRMLAEEGSSFRAVLLGKRQQGKTDLLQQVHRQLFQRAEGPIPFLYVFPRGREPEELALHFCATFCRQVRAFQMRREDLLREPAGPLEREMEQPGLPLVLSELAREMLALLSRGVGGLASPTGHALESVSLLPARFAQCEGRPVCLLLDEAQALTPQSPFFAALEAPDLCWLLAGRLPFLLQRAGEAAWPVLRLEPFSLEEALTIAETRCRAAGVPFSKQAWQQWCEQAGTSPWLIGLLVQAAAVEGESLDEVEQLGEVYVRELTTGTLGNWLNVRWQQAVPDRRERARLVELLWNFARGALPSSATASLAPELWDGLVAEAWAEETPTGPQFCLDSIQRDWLETVVESTASQERRQSRLLQAFLQRAGQPRRGWPGKEPFASLRQRLLELPQAGLPEVLEWEGSEIRPPRIGSIAMESEHSAELFWCYGFRGGHSGQVETPCVLLIALCRQAPTIGAVQAWSRQLDQEARLLPATEDAGASSTESSGLRQELWVVVPESASRVSLASERRFSWEALAGLLGVTTSPADNEKAASSCPQDQLSLLIAPRCEATAITMLEQIAERQALAAEATDALRLALTEACRNAVQHSHNPGGKLLIDYCISSSNATLNIFNEGVSFGSQQEEALPEAARGTGLKLIRSLMDEVSFQAEPHGTRLIITKKFQPEATVH